MIPNLDPKKDDARATLEDVIKKEWLRPGPMYTTSVVMRNPVEGDLTIDPRFNCAGHRELSEALVCMESAIPGIRKQIAKERNVLLARADEVSHVIGRKFDPARDMRTAYICVIKTDCEIVEFASG